VNDLVNKEEFYSWSKNQLLWPHSFSELLDAYIKEKKSNTLISEVNEIILNDLQINSSLVNISTSTTNEFLQESKDDFGIKSIFRNGVFELVQSDNIDGEISDNFLREELEGDTDNEHLSLEDIDLEDISPEPAGGDFYESDTDSYLSLSLEDGDTGSLNGDGDSLCSGRRKNIKKYRYRKVLIPSVEQLDTLDLQDGQNEISFELEGCSPLTAQLFVWPENSKIVVTDIEGVITNLAKQPMDWVSYLAGRSIESNTACFEGSVELFNNIANNGYKIIYIAQNSISTLSSSSSGQPKPYLSKIISSNGMHLPSGPVFKSPDSLVRAFGASRTDVFKAAALRGVRSLFPNNYNPYHACFGTRECDMVC
jgi:hypothetical protein